MAREPDMSLLMTAPGSQAHRKTLAKIPSKSTVFTIKQALLLIKMIKSYLLLENVIWLSWKYFLKYEALMALSPE